MNPKSGKAGNAVDPAKPKEAYDADDADPGKVEEAKTDQAQTKTGKYGSAKSTPHKPPEEEDETTTKKSWIEIELVDEAKAPVPGEGYEITLPDGSVAKGTLDGKGFARVEGIEPGTCKVTFPDLDKDAWEPA
jgi:uncharacterized protein (DUF2345 family)